MLASSSSYYGNFLVEIACSPRGFMCWHLAHQFLQEEDGSRSSSISYRVLLLPRLSRGTTHTTVSYLTLYE